jgi:hypothetical protein
MVRIGALVGVFEAAAEGFAGECKGEVGGVGEIGCYVMEELCG